MRKQLTVTGVLGFACVLVQAAHSVAGVFTVVNSNASGPGSLSDAMTKADQAGQPSQVVFAIPGAGVHRIDVSGTSLPPLGPGITIDGYSQPGAKPNDLAVGDDAVILIHLDGTNGSNVSPGPGLRIVGSDCVIRGLSITGFTAPDPTGVIANANYGAAIYGDSSLMAVQRVQVTGNFIGLTPDGVLRRNRYGTLGSLDTIGGSTPDTRNVISGNTIGIQGGLNINGNYIGSDPSGLKMGFGNTIGIEIDGGRSTPPYVTIGGTTPAQRNIVSGNGSGIRDTGVFTVIEGNYIGVGADGTTSVGNGNGIIISGTDNKIGGMAPGQGNVMAYNGNGITVSGTTDPQTPDAVRNSIISNQIYGNSGIGIDLDGDGVTHNDIRDLDSGANTLQNFPVISSVTSIGNATTVTGALNSTPSTTFTLQFFANGSSSAPSQTLLGTQSVTTNGVGDVGFTVTFPTATTAQQFISATATDPNGNTSELTPQKGIAILANISTRGEVLTGDNILIGGFIIRHTPAHLGTYILARALGPSLGISGSLSDPRLDLFASDGTMIGSNDNWKSTQQSDIEATGLAPSNDAESAIFSALPDGAYTAQVRGVNNTTGIGIVEIYEVGPIGSRASGELANISTRGFVGTADAVLIGGIIINGDVPQQVLFRGIGPDLASAGVASPLQDPGLELHNAEGDVIATNDNWRSSQESAINATGIPPKDDRDAAILITLVPSSYTAIVRGVDGSTGIALVEAYKVP